MAIILLVRHGENEYVRKKRLAGRLPGVTLNENGRKQAQALAEKLAGTPVKAIYSSPLERCVETAEPIADALGLEVIRRPGLMEVDIGDWQNKTLKGLSRLKLWRVVQAAPSFMHFPGGESFADAQYRACREIDTLVAQHDPMDMLVCVSHSDLIKLIVAYYIGLPLDLFQRLHVSPASITVLNIGEASSHLLTLNYEISFTLRKE